MPRYRCHNADCAPVRNGPLGFDFVADAPVCPKCQTDGTDPNFGQLIDKLVDVHLIVPDPTGPIISKNLGRRRIACQPTRSDMGGDCTAVAADPAAVTCVACRSTDDFKAATDRFAVDGPRGIQAGQPLGTTI